MIEKIMSPFCGRRSPRVDIFILLFASFAVKSILLSITEVITTDGPVYIQQAMWFLDGNWHAGLARNGFYPLLIASLSFFVPDLVVSGRIISFCSSVFAVVPLYLLFLRSWNQRVAFWGGLAFVVSPGMNMFAVDIMRDPLFVFTVVCAVYFASLAFSSQSVVFYSLSSLFSVVAFFTRIEGLLLVFVLVFYALASFVFGKSRIVEVIKPLVVYSIPFCLILVVIFSSYGDHVRELVRVVDLKESIELFLAKENTSNYAAIKIKLKEFSLGLPGEDFKNNFSDIARSHIRLIYVIGLVSLFAKVMYFPFFCCLLLCLLVSRTFRSDYYLSILVVMSYFLLAYLFNLYMGFLEYRYVYVPVVLSFAFVGSGFVYFVDYLGKKNFKAIFLCFFVIFFSLFPIFESAKYTLKRQAISTKEAGEWLARHDEHRDSVVASNSRKIAFYANRFEDYWHADLHDLKDVANTGNADLIAIELEVDSLNAFSGFHGYKILTQFMDDNYCSVIYEKI